MNLIKAVIIDDEPAAVDVIRALIKEFALRIEVVGIATNGLEAIHLITQQHPDLLFLDVDMPIVNGLQVLEKFPGARFEVIFTTGSSEYALRALKLKAVDYLLKPIDPADFLLAIEKAKENINARQNTSGGMQKIQLPAQNGIIFIDDSDIIYVAGMGSYCQVNLLNKEKITVSKGIGQLEEKLSRNRFFRCHNSYIINLDYVTKFINKEGYAVEMQDGTQIDVSRRAKDGLLDMLREKAN